MSAASKLGEVEGWDDVHEAQSANVCPINQCGRPAKDRLMCSSHWRLVAHEARNALADAGKAYRAARRAKQRLGAAYLSWEAAACLCIHLAETHARG